MHGWLARAILAERYARGDIDADEYRKRLETLNTLAERGLGA
jgi:uncharacterized membrane protein